MDTAAHDTLSTSPDPVLLEAAVSLSLAGHADAHVQVTAANADAWANLPCDLLRTWVRTTGVPELAKALGEVNWTPEQVQVIREVLGARGATPLTYLLLCSDSVTENEGREILAHVRATHRRVIAGNLHRIQYRRLPDWAVAEVSDIVKDDEFHLLPLDLVATEVLLKRTVGTTAIAVGRLAALLDRPLTTHQRGRVIRALRRNLEQLTKDGKVAGKPRLAMALTWLLDPDQDLMTLANRTDLAGAAALPVQAHLRLLADVDAATRTHRHVRIATLCPYLASCVRHADQRVQQAAAVALRAIPDRLETDELLVFDAEIRKHSRHGNHPLSQRMLLEEVGAATEGVLLERVVVGDNAALEYCARRKKTFGLDATQAAHLGRTVPWSLLRELDGPERFLATYLADAYTQGGTAGLAAFLGLLEDQDGTLPLVLAAALAAAR